MVQLPIAALGALLLLPALGAAPKSKLPTVALTPGLEMDGGRRLLFERSFTTERDLKPKQSLFTRIVNFVAGAGDTHYLVRPYSVVTDSRDRVIIADPGAMGIHIIDLAQQKYKFTSHRDGKDPLGNPQCVATDQRDNIYVTDPDAGKIFVFDANGKFQRAIGSLRGGEGFFKRPTGIAVDSAAQRIYVADTWRDRIYVIDMQGRVLQTIGHYGHGPAEFDLPTELRLAGDDLMVTDAMNFRVQVLSKTGAFRYAVGTQGEKLGQVFRPKGIGVDSEGHLYIADSFNHLVQAFDAQGRLLYYFGYEGTTPLPLQAPAGLSVDRNDRILVVDPQARRLEIFRYYGAALPAIGGTR